MSESDIYSWLIFLGASVVIVKVIILLLSKQKLPKSEPLISRIVMSVAFLFISISSIVRNGIPVTETGSVFLNIGWTVIAIILLIAGLYYGMSIFTDNKKKENIL